MDFIYTFAKQRNYMVEIKGYSDIDVARLQKILEKAFASSDIVKEELALALGVNSQTIDNCTIIYSPKKEPNTKSFKASDKILCLASKALGINLVIVVEDGKKRYYIKK